MLTNDEIDLIRTEQKIKIIIELENREIPIKGIILYNLVRIIY